MDHRPHRLQHTQRHISPLVFAGLSLVVVGGLPATLMSCKKSTPPQASTLASRQISALGRLEPRSMVRKITVPASLNGDQVAELLVDETETVNKGQALAILISATSLKAALAEAERQVEVEESKLQQVLAGTQQNEILAQEYRVQSLERQLVAEKRTLDQEVASASTRARTAKIEAQRYQELYSAGGISALERDRYSTRAATTQAEMNRAIEKRAGAESRLNADIAGARQTLARLRDVRPEDVNAARSNVRRAQAARDRAAADLELATVRAPEAGQILRIFTRPGERVGENGILEMANTDSMIVTAEVYQSDLPHLSIGQGATISADGFSSTVRATLEKILPQVQRQNTYAGTPGENMDQRVFEVRLAIHPAAGQKQQIRFGTNLQVNVLFDVRPGSQNAGNDKRGKQS